MSQYFRSSKLNRFLYHILLQHFYRVLTHIRRLTPTHLYESMEDLEDLFLDEDREDGGVSQQLADELLNPQQEDLHGRQQRLPLICLPVPEVHTHAHEPQGKT